MAENKEYSIVGQVTIGTDEYRDLIRGLAETEASLSEYRSKSWKLETEVKKANENAEAVSRQYRDLLAFVQSSEELKAKYQLFLVQRKVSEEAQI